jgi:hypothetical protein
MSDSNDNTNWRANLTAEQQAMVLKAAIAGYENPWDSGPHSWKSCQGKDHYCADTLASLRAVGAIPPAKVKTRGEEAAAEYVQQGSSLDGKEQYLVITRHGYGTRVFKGPVAQFDLWRDCVRQRVAAIIDAERAAAFEEAASIVRQADLLPTTSAEVFRIRTAKLLDAKSREHLRDDVAQPHEPAAPSL